MEKLVVKNRIAEDTEFNVFTKTTMRDGRIFQTKDVQYFEYPELAQKGRNGLLSFDKAKGFRKDLRLVDKVCDVKPDGEIVVKSERLRSFNLGQGAGERETRGLVKSQRLNGKWRVYEYAGGGAQPSKIYSPEEAVEESSEIGVPGIGGSATTYDGVTPATYTFGNGDTISYSNGGDTESYTKSGASAPEETFAFTRENGNVTAVQSGQGSYAYTYGNDSSMPLSESYPDGHTLTREIDAAGNVRSVTLKDAQGAVLYAVAYTYNPNGSIAAVTAEGKTVSYSYNSLWQVSSVNLGGTASIDYAYDGLGMLSSAKYVAGGQTLKGNEYAYDALGKIISVNVLKDGASVGAWKYGYNDILSALTSAGFYTGTQEDAPLADEYSFEAYNYDAAGNITSAKRNASEASAYWDTHATDPGNRLVSLYNAQDRMFPIRGSAASNASLKISVDGVETQIQRADGQEDFVFALDNSANASPLISLMEG